MNYTIDTDKLIICANDYKDVDFNDMNAALKATYSIISKALDKFFIQSRRAEINRMTEDVLDYNYFKYAKDLTPLIEIINSTEEIYECKAKINKLCITLETKMVQEKLQKNYNMPEEKAKEFMENLFNYHEEKWDTIRDNIDIIAKIITNPKDLIKSTFHCSQEMGWDIYSYQINTNKRSQEDGLSDNDARILGEQFAEKYPKKFILIDAMTEEYLVKPYNIRWLETITDDTIIITLEARNKDEQEILNIIAAMGSDKHTMTADNTAKISIKDNEITIHFDDDFEKKILKVELLQTLQRYSYNVRIKTIKKKE